MEQKEEFELGCGIEITLDKPDSFNILRESLTRIGIKSKKAPILWQSCHILHKRGRYFILHFKELFFLSGRDNQMVEDDYNRRDTIVKLLIQWKLCRAINMDIMSRPTESSDIAIIPFKDKKDYQLIAKFTVGKKKNGV